LTTWQAENARPTASGGNPDPTTGGESEEAGDRQLGHPLQVWSVLMSLLPPAKAGEITMTATAAPKSKLFMGLSLERNGIKSNRHFASNHLFRPMILSEKSATFRDHAPGPQLRKLR
jgi:hypothetical protein